MIQKYSSEKEHKRRLFLPLSLFIPFAIIFSFLVLTLIFLGPIVFFRLQDMIFDGFISPLILILIFFFVLFITILLLFYMIRINEKIKSRYECESPMPMNELSTHGSYDDSDRSYLEQKISQLSNQLLSSQKRWEEVNHLVLSSHEKNISSSGIFSSKVFLDRFNIDPDDITVDKQLVFVLTPFHDDNVLDFSQVRRICDDLKLRALRGDEENIKGDILSHIVKCMLESRIIIANISGRNPNVFYELGIAHAINKPTILISRIESDIPFDLKNRFVIIYSNKKELDQKLRAMLLNILVD